ncbi:hypothetical protein ACKS0A_01627 [Histoplasma ohiense]
MQMLLVWIHNPHYYHNRSGSNSLLVKISLQDAQWRPVSLGILCREKYHCLEQSARLFRVHDLGFCSPTGPAHPDLRIRYGISAG